MAIPIRISLSANHEFVVCLTEFPHDRIPLVHVLSRYDCRIILGKLVPKETASHLVPQQLGPGCRRQRKKRRADRNPTVIVSLLSQGSIAGISKHSPFRRTPTETGLTCTAEFKRRIPTRAGIVNFPERFEVEIT